jgi:hypothetical protein
MRSSYLVRVYTVPAHDRRLTLRYRLCRPGSTRSAAAGRPESHCRRNQFASFTGPAPANAELRPRSGRKPTIRPHPQGGAAEAPGHRADCADTPGRDADRPRDDGTWAGRSARVGYLLKDKVADVDQLLDNAATVAAGGICIDTDLQGFPPARRQTDAGPAQRHRTDCQGAGEQRCRGTPAHQRRPGRAARRRHTHRLPPTRPRRGAGTEGQQSVF